MLHHGSPLTKQQELDLRLWSLAQPIQDLIDFGDVVQVTLVPDKAENGEMRTLYVDKKRMYIEKRGTP